MWTKYIQYRSKLHIKTIFGNFWNIQLKSQTATLTSKRNTVLPPYKCWRNIWMVHIERVLASVSFWQKFTSILSFLFFWTLIGTTWTQEMVWCIMNDFNYAEGKKATLDEKFPYFEWVSFFKSILFFCHFKNNVKPGNLKRIKWPKLCNQVPSLSLSRWRTLTLLKI